VPKADIATFHDAYKPEMRNVSSEVFRPYRNALIIAARLLAAGQVLPSFSDRPLFSLFHG
jgi:hypothetical protein